MGTGLLTGCELEADSNTAPWSVDVNGTTDLKITNVGITNAFDENCIASGTRLSFSEVTATPDNSGEIGSVTLSGTGTAEGLGSAEAGGTLEAESPDNKTYGLT